MSSIRSQVVLWKQIFFYSVRSTTTSRKGSCALSASIRCKCNGSAYFTGFEIWLIVHGVELDGFQIGSKPATEPSLLAKREQTPNRGKESSTVDEGKESRDATCIPLFEVAQSSKHSKQNSKTLLELLCFCIGYWRFSSAPSQAISLSMQMIRKEDTIQKQQTRRKMFQAPERFPKKLRRQTSLSARRRQFQFFVSQSDLCRSHIIMDGFTLSA